MNRARTLVAIGAVVVGAAIAWFVVADGASESARFPAAAPEPGPPLPPRAVLAFGTGAADAEAAVVSADGRVEFLDASKGTVLRTVETGVKAWTLRFRNPSPVKYPGSKLEYPEMVLAGAPVAVAGGRIVAVVEDGLLEWDVAGKTRDLLRATWLRETRLLVHAGPGRPVFLALADGRQAQVEEGRAAFASGSGAGTPTAMVLTGADGLLVVGGTGPLLEVLGAGDLLPRRGGALRYGPPPVTALGASAAGDRIAAAAGWSNALELFEAGPGGLSRVEGGNPGFHAKMPPFMGVALGADRKTAALARYGGALAESLYHGGSHGGGADGVPSRAVGLFCLEGTVLHGRDDGTVAGFTHPDVVRVWTRER